MCLITAPIDLRQDGRGWAVMGVVIQHIWRAPSRWQLRVYFRNGGGVQECSCQGFEPKAFPSLICTILKMINICYKRRKVLLTKRHVLLQPRRHGIGSFTRPCAADTPSLRKQTGSTLPSRDWDSDLQPYGWRLQSSPSVPPRLLLDGKSRGEGGRGGGEWMIWETVFA